MTALVNPLKPLVTATKNKLNFASNVRHLGFWVDVHTYVSITYVRMTPEFSSLTTPLSLKPKLPIAAEKQ